jgi:hypothetical protein
MGLGRWTNQQLDGMRELTDSLADGVIAAIIAADGVDAVDEILSRVARNRDAIPDDLPPVVRDYFTMDLLPDWADPELLRHGEVVFDLYGPQMISMLFFVSLPNAYAAGNGAQVLDLTARLLETPERRIFRTAQFIMDVMQPGGLGPLGRGMISTKKVRLIHAAVRHYIADREHWRDQWDPAWGKPINQEDLAGTMMDFCVGVLQGLQSAGVGLDEQEQAAYVHAWSVVGHVIGVRPELIPTGVQDAFDLANTITGRQWRQSTAGAALAAAEIGFFHKHLPKGLAGLPRTAMRRFAGNQVGDLLQLGPPDWTRILVAFQIMVFKLLEVFKASAPGFYRLGARFMVWLINRIIFIDLGGRRWTFDIPDSLRDSWRMPASGDTG